MYFVKYTLDEDARKYYDETDRREKTWEEIDRIFVERYASESKHRVISNRLTNLMIEYCRKLEDEGDSALLDHLVC